MAQSRRRMTTKSRVILAAIVVALCVIIAAASVSALRAPTSTTSESARQQLASLAVKGRAPLTGYTREAFYKSWTTKDSCSTAEEILRRDLDDVVYGPDCRVASGVLHDPYTGTDIPYAPGGVIQIDHVVALANAWQTGAFAWSAEQRKAYANDPFVLLAVSGKENMAKGAGDAATWLPPNKGYRCTYVTQQIAIKAKYALWVTQPERDAMLRVLDTC